MEPQSYVEIMVPRPVHPAIEVAAPVPAPAPAPEPPATPEVKAASAAAPEVKAKPRPVAASTPVNRKGGSISLTGAVIVIVAAIGFPLGTYWLGRKQQVITMSEAQSADTTSQAPAAPVDQPVPSSAVVPADAPAPPKRAVEETPPPVKVSTPPVKVSTPPVKVSAPPVKVSTPPPPPRPVAPPPMKQLPGTPTPTRDARPNTSSRPPAPVPTPVEAPRVEVAPPVLEPVVPAPPAPEPPAAAEGPFFEQRQVDQMPGIASRVEPNVPAGLGALNEVVVVRVLVSQTGHPSVVNLLRRSNAGSDLDEAVVAAVRRWTFSPARKRGAAVSCWYNVAVPIKRSE